MSSPEPGPSPESEAPASYEITCPSCRTLFDALETPFCSCLTSPRTVVCPACLHCLCKAPGRIRNDFWAQAPQALWDRRLADAPQVVDPTPPDDPAEVQRPLVLIIDDDRDIRRLATRLMEGLGFGVVVAREGKGGLELARRFLPDLILSDALMPGLDGRELCRQLRQEADLAKTPVVLMSAIYRQLRYRHEAIETYGADDFLVKPVDFEALRAVIRRHLGAAQAEPAEL